MKQLKIVFAVLAMSLGLVAVPAALPVHAVEVFDVCDDIEDSTVCNSTENNLPSAAKIIVNTLLVVLGMAAVVMIVIGGIYYATSNGEASKVKTGKDTILYAVIGLIIAILAFSIVNFVLDAF